mmetsp:Transcript_38007/g.70701  ORF Transcript_38007/g.70701 Transcript_38007/m.70701 type:complete len:127 (-) Transcript_38007:1367-1747(-)
MNSLLGKAPPLPLPRLMCPKSSQVDMAALKLITSAPMPRRQRTPRRKLGGRRCRNWSQSMQYVKRESCVFTQVSIPKTTRLPSTTLTLPNVKSRIANAINGLEHSCPTSTCECWSAARTGEKTIFK